MARLSRIAHHLQFDCCASVTFGYSVTPDYSRLRYNETQTNKAEAGGVTCTASVVPETFAVKREGNCLVLTPKNSNAIYYIRRKN